LHGVTIITTVTLETTIYEIKHVWMGLVMIILVRVQNLICNNHNINLLIQILNGSQWKNMCVFIQNTRLNIFSNGSKITLDNIMGCKMLPSPLHGNTKKIIFPWFYRLKKMQWAKPWVVGWEKPNLICNIKRKCVKSYQMIRW